MSSAAVADKKSGAQSKSSRPKRKNSAASRLRARAEEIGRTEVDYMYNKEFDVADVQVEIEATSLLDPEQRSRKAKRPPGLPSYLASLYEVPLLSAAHEAALFRKMNYLKHRANQVRAKLNLSRPSKAKMAEFERLMDESERIRNRIARCNLRLVVSIARKFADRDNPFDDFVSDGNVALLHAIAKFDYGRGFRFSTYATHAIRRMFYRQVQQKKRRNDRVMLGPGEMLSEAADGHEQIHLDARQYGDVCDLLTQMKDRLDEREQAIVEARFGLTDSEEAETLQRVAKRLGICKERVRQLQNRALDKLRELAVELRIEAPVFLSPEN
ncbi:sigma-70 family RNA polymerase sigma factor [Stratiformator vulcanicus]|uniref:RNA polymerase sigma factor RpoD n=1 Tax=Stratiformator vulcanicus TaxID=2527980 RepID=A0A517R0H5_9PLAN|nr:sigma-70 family RNA polymerase sigma factor [Stratiformator vulcanicus]QDT37333.1 RNA polymerase sigma factor RpoD [Stratiformator vulcanicus]